MSALAADSASSSRARVGAAIDVTTSVRVTGHLRGAARQAAGLESASPIARPPTWWLDES